MKLHFKQQNVQLIVVFVISLYALYLRFYRLANRDLWMDETYALGFMKGSFKPFWRHLSYGDHTSFPGEYLLNYPVVQLFGTNANKWGLAIPHMIMTVIGFYFLFKLCQRYFHTIWGYLIAFMVVCLNTNLIFHSFEFRPYAVLPTLALASLYFSDVLIKEFNQISPIKKFLIGMFFIITVNYHAYGILIALLPLFYTVISVYFDKTQTISWKGPLRYFSVILTIAIPIWCWYASSNHFGMATTIHVQGVRNPFEYIPNPLTHALGFAKGVVGNLAGDRKLYVLFISILLTFFLPHKYRISQWAFLFVLIIFPVGLILFVDIKTQYWFLQRQFVWVMPLFAFFLGWCWETVFVFFMKTNKFENQLSNK